MAVVPMGGDGGGGQAGWRKLDVQVTQHQAVAVLAGSPVNLAARRLKPVSMTPIGSKQ